MMQLEFCPHCKKRLVPRPVDVKRLRESAGLTQRQFAAMLGVSAAHVAYLESAERNASGDLILKYRALEKRLLSKADRQLSSVRAEMKVRAKKQKREVKPITERVTDDGSQETGP